MGSANAIGQCELGGVPGEIGALAVSPDEQRVAVATVVFSTFPAPSGVADLRPRTSSDVVVSIGGVLKTVRGTKLEQPPSQQNGGGFNTSLSVPAVSVATPLAPGASIDLQFLMGIQQTGDFWIGMIPAALPAARKIRGFYLERSTLDCGPCRRWRTSSETRPSVTSGDQPS